jgi:Delta24-sterol reductase
VTRESDEDLWFALPHSYGTLCLLVGAEISIIPAKPFVKLVYRPVDSVQRSVDDIRHLSEQKGADAADFVEGLLYSRHRYDTLEGRGLQCLCQHYLTAGRSFYSGVVIEGKMVDDAPSSFPFLSLFMYWHLFYYEHVRRMLKKHGSEPWVEYMTLYDYYFR